MKAIEFIVKFAFGCFMAWLVLAILSIVVGILGYCWKLLFAGLGIYGIYLVVTGKYKEFSVKMEDFYSDIIGIVKH